MARYPQGILVACPSPWDDRDELVEEILREEIRLVLAAGFEHCYVFGTGGEGYAVDTRRFRQVVDVWAEHIDAIRTDGLVVEGASGTRTARIKATTDPAEVGACELVVVATKALDVEAAAASAAPLVGPDTVVLPIQNGLGSADRIAAVLGEERVAIGVAGGFGASMVGPGHVHHNGWELVRLGERRGPATARIHRIAETWLNAGFRVQVYDVVDRLVWE